jgi:polysaccharide export outer membrane protein
MKALHIMIAVQVGLHLGVCQPVSAEQDQPTPPAPLAIPTAAAASGPAPAPDYLLGPDDVIAIRALHADEVNVNGIRIDPAGEISLPLLGRFQVAGLTVQRLEQELIARLRTYVREPVLAVTVVEYRSQPVSVIGSVSRAGVHQLEGRKTLIEILATAGGLTPDAGHIVKVTRRIGWGMIPAPSATLDPSGQFSIAEISLTGIIQGTSPQDNIQVLPNDIISVPRGALIYVLGEVNRPGGFVLQERRTVSGLHALAMAQGFTASASPGKAMIIRDAPGGERMTIEANIRDILDGKAEDVTLLPNDILIVPNNVARSVLGRTLQTAISALTSASIYRVY